MLTKKVKSRILLLSIVLILLTLIIFITLKSLRENVVYFLSPSEVFNSKNISYEEKIRVGGLVKVNSINK